MNLGLNIAASGMLAEQLRQDQLTNDLANSSTPGYKADVAQQTSFGSLLLSNTSTGAPIGSLITDVRIGRTVTNLAPGSVKATGQPLDFAIDGAGFFAVNTPAGIRYTRDGQFTSSAAGFLVDDKGNQVLGPNNAPIPIGPQGKIPGTSVGVFNLTGPQKQGENLYTGTRSGGLTGAVREGFLENSSVNPVSTMVDMIASLRAYEAGQKAIQSIDETMGESASSVGALNG